MEILQAENRRLQNQLKLTRSIKVSSAFDDEEVLPFTPPPTIEVTKERLKRLSNEIRQRDSDYLSDSDKDSNHNLVGKSDNLVPSDKNYESQRIKDDQAAHDEFEQLLYESDESDEDVRACIRELSEASKNDSAVLTANGVHSSNDSESEITVDLSKLTSSSSSSQPNADPDWVDSSLANHDPDASYNRTSSAALPPNLQNTSKPYQVNVSYVETQESSPPPPTTASCRSSTSKECASENCHFKAKGLAASKPLSRSENKLSGIFPWQSAKYSNSLTRSSLANKNRSVFVHINTFPKQF